MYGIDFINIHSHTLARSRSFTYPPKRRRSVYTQTRNRILICPPAPPGKRRLLFAIIAIHSHRHMTLYVCARTNMCALFSFFFPRLLFLFFESEIFGIEFRQLANRTLDVYCYAIPSVRPIPFDKGQKNRLSDIALRTALPINIIIIPHNFGIAQVKI